MVVPWPNDRLTTARHVLEFADCHGPFSVLLGAIDGSSSLQVSRLDGMPDWGPRVINHISVIGSLGNAFEDYLGRGPKSRYRARSRACPFRKQTPEVV